MRKRELYASLRKDLVHYQRNVNEIRKDISQLRQMDMRNSNYRICLEEQVRDEDLAHIAPTKVDMRYQGSLAEAIRILERKFSEEKGIELDGIREIPIEYIAQIRVGKRWYHLPKKIVYRAAGIKSIFE